MHRLRITFAAVIASMLMALVLVGCAGQSAEEGSSADGSQQAGAVTVADATSDDMNEAFYLMATALSPDSPMASVYIEGDPDAREVRATFVTEEDGTDASVLAQEAEALCAKYSLAVAQAALAREQNADEPNQDVIDQWQALVDAEQAAVDGGETDGALFDTYKAIAVIQTPDATTTFDGERDAGMDSQWRWQ